MSVFQRSRGAETADSIDEQAALVQRLTQFTASWNRPRQRLTQSVGKVQGDAGVVLLEQMKGKLTQKMGFTWKGNRYLLMEEAMYLVDQGSLLIFEDQPQYHMGPLTIQETLELMVKTGVPLDRYLIYADLKNNGYVVFRHPVTFSVTAESCPIQVWEQWHQSCHSKQPAAIFDVFDGASSFKRSVSQQPGKCIVHISSQQFSFQEIAEVESKATVDICYAFERDAEIIYYSFNQFG